MELLLSLLRIALGVYVGLLLLVYFRQASYIYYPARELDGDPSLMNLAYRDVTLRTQDGETLAAWFVPAGQEAEAPTLLFCHGNAGNMADRLGSIATFHELGLNVLIFDYRGYGRSTGRPTEAGTRLDAEAAWDYLTGELAIPPARIVLFGRSLGGAVAVAQAARHPPGLLVVESSFASVADMGRRMFPYLPVRWLCRHPYDSEKTIRSVRCPVLVAHGPDDTTVPFAHGQRLFAAANEPKRFVTLQGGHNEGGMDSDPAYRAIFREWVATHLTPRAGSGAQSAHGDID